MKKKNSLRFIVVGWVLVGWANLLHGQSTAFSYQGRLNENGNPATGSYDLQFTLCTAATNGSALGVVTNSSVAISNGLFTVLLDFGAAVFNGGARWLQIGVRPGGSGVTFSVLQPRQPVASTPYAITALSAGSIPAGSVTSVELADGGEELLRLAKPYQSGAVSMETFSTLGGFGSYQTTWTVTYPEPFASLPIVTISLDSPLNSAQRIGPILVAQKRTDGFDLLFNVPNLPVRVASRSTVGAGLMAMVNGRPAMFYDNGSYYFARSLDANGRRWPVGTSVGVAINGNGNYCFSMVNGFPALAYQEYFTRHFKFIRATDTNGATWAAPVTIQTNSVSGFSPAEIRLAIISGRPAIAWLDAAASTNIYYIRANDANGDNWPASPTIVTGGQLSGLSLAEINGRPAISYGWDNGLPFTNELTALRFLRASDSTGSSWPPNAAISVKTNGYNTAYSSTQLLSVSNNPAIFYQFANGQSVTPIHTEFVRATDTNGTAWGGVVTMMPSPTQTGIQSASLVNGQPAVVWYDYSRSSFRYSVSPNNGSRFSTGFLYQNIFASTPFLLDVNGLPAASFASPDTSELLYIRDTNLIPDTYINWIAVAP